MNRENLWQMDLNRFLILWLTDFDKRLRPWTQFQERWMFYDLVPVNLLESSEYFDQEVAAPNEYVVDIDA